VSSSTIPRTASTSKRRSRRSSGDAYAGETGVGRYGRRRPPEDWPFRSRESARHGATALADDGRLGATRLLGQKLFEARGVVERPDQREVQPVARDHVLRHPLDVLDGDLVELAEDLLRLRRAALEHLPS
jgi:hypothetical protein